VNASRPREYATAFLAARTKDDQRKALRGCPEAWQSLVRKHIEIQRQRQANG